VSCHTHHSFLFFGVTTLWDEMTSAPKTQPRYATIQNKLFVVLFARRYSIKGSFCLIQWPNQPGSYLTIVTLVGLWPKPSYAKARAALRSHLQPSRLRPRGMNWLNTAQDHAADLSSPSPQASERPRSWQDCHVLTLKRLSSSLRVSDIHFSLWTNISESLPPKNAESIFDHPSADIVNWYLWRQLEYSKCRSHGVQTLSVAHGAQEGVQGPRQRPQVSGPHAGGEFLGEFHSLSFTACTKARANSAQKQKLN
jgi:hypothetical protein